MVVTSAVHAENDRYVLKQAGRFVTCSTPRRNNTSQSGISPKVEHQTFLTSQSTYVAGTCSDEDSDIVLAQLQAAAEKALLGSQPKKTASKEECQILESLFLKRLYQAYADAKVQGDEDSAKAVMDAIVAEGGSIPKTQGQENLTQPAAQHSDSEQKACASTRRPLGPRDVRRIRQPADIKCAHASSNSNRSRRGRMKELIEAQFGRFPSGAEETTPLPRNIERNQEFGSAEDDSADEKECHVECPEGSETSTGQIGSLSCWPARFHRKLFDQATHAKQQRSRRAGNKPDLKSLNIRQGDVLSSSSTELPGNGLPQHCRQIIEAWHSGLCSGSRCLSALASTLYSHKECTEDLLDGIRLPGQASWKTLSRMCGFPGGNDVIGNPLTQDAAHSRVDTNSFFDKGPWFCIKETLSGIRKEAGLSPLAPLSIDELHFGLRSLELQARSGNDSGLHIRVLAGRELLRIHLNGKATDVSPKQTVAEALMIISRPQAASKAGSIPLELLDECKRALNGFTRCLLEEIENVKTYGHYAALGLESDASEGSIRRAYRDLCLKHHPDKGGDTATFQSLQQAHETILEDLRKGIRPKKPTKVAGEQAATEDSGNVKECHAKASGFPGSPSKASEEARRQPPWSPAAEGSANDLVEEVLQLAKTASEASKSAQEASVLCNSLCSLLNCLHCVVSETASVAIIASQVSTKVLAAASWDLSGDLAEEVIAASQRCAEAGSEATKAATRCERLAVAVAEDAVSNGMEDLLACGKEACSTAVAAALNATSAVEEADRVLQAAAFSEAACKASTRKRPGYPEASGRFNAGYSYPQLKQKKRDKAPDDCQRRPQSASFTATAADGTAHDSGEQRKTRRDDDSDLPYTKMPSHSMPGAKARVHEEVNIARLTEILELNKEALRLQGELHSLLLASPLLIPKICQSQRQRVFKVASEVLLEVANQVINEGLIFDQMSEMLCGTPDVALFECRIGVIRLATIIDLETLLSIIKEPFSEMLNAAMPGRQRDLATSIGMVVDQLPSWVRGKAS